MRFACKMTTMQTTAPALDHLLRATGNPVAELRDIGPAHPEFGQAQVIRAAAAVLAKIPDTLRAVAQVIETTDRRRLLPQSRAHLAAAEAWLAGDPVRAAECYAAIVAHWPDDLLALRLAQSCYFFLGAHERLVEVVDMAMSAGPRDRQGHDFVLAMASFAHAELGNAAYAEALGRQALVNDAACPIGVHAVTHAIAESGQHRKGAQWMREQCAHWAGESRMRTHNAWHLAMFDVEDGNIPSALGILDGWLLPSIAGSPLDACDATALLWRLASEGVDVADRWRRISDAFEGTLAPGFWPYVDLHAAIAHIAAGAPARMQGLAAAIERCSHGGNHAAVRARHITGPGLRALGAWAEGRYREAAARLAILHPFLESAGGSRIQLELFGSIEREANRRHDTVARAGDRSWLPSILAPGMPESTSGLLAAAVPGLPEASHAHAWRTSITQLVAP